MQIHRWLPLTLFIGALCVSDASADTVTLVGGDQLTGTVKRLADGKVVFKTDWASDEIKIKVDKIEGISTEKPFTVRWDDGSEKVGRLTVTGDGKIGVVFAQPTSTAAQVVSAEAVEKSADDPLEKLEDEADVVLAEAEPKGAPATEILDAEKAAKAATLAAKKYAAAEGRSTVASEDGVVNLSDVAWIRPIERYYRYEGNFNLGINMARGNANTTNVHIDGMISPSFGRNTVVVSGQLDRGKADGQLNRSNWNIGAQYNRDFGVRRRWYGTVVNTYENNELADLNLRVTAGAGVGYKFFDQRPTLLKISISPVYVNENFQTAPNRSYFAARWALDFEQDLWSEDVTFYHRDTMTFGITESQYVLRTTTGITFDLISDLTASIEVQYDYLAEPPPDAVPDDQRYMFKIGYKFRGDESDWWQ